MQTRRDQLQAHYFVVGRLVSALLRAEPDAPEGPMQRFAKATFAGVLVAVIVLAVAGIWGYVSPGSSKAWKTAGALIVEKETGARYVYRNELLRPVANHASARLILGADMTVKSVSRKSLRGVAHGAPIGIASAPDFLPEKTHLTGAYWQVCSTLRADDTGTDVPYVTLSIGSTKPTPLANDRGLLVATEDGTTYLAWKGKRYRISGGAALTALGYGSTTPAVVGSAFINALPAGPDLRAPEVPGTGGVGPVVDGSATTIGQVFVVRSAGGADQYFAVRADGLSALTETDAVLLLARGTSKAIELSPSVFGSAPRSATSTVTTDFPASPPEVTTQASSTQVPCVFVTVNTSGAGQSLVGLGRAAVGESSAGTAGVDEVIVEAGTGVLLRSQPAPGVTTGALYLLTDLGIRYGLPSDDVVALLGYAGLTPVQVPSSLVSLIESGPVLNPTDALGSPTTTESLTGAVTTNTGTP